MKAKKRRGGEWVPEDRLPAALLGAGVLVPFAMLFFGLVTTFDSAKIGSVVILAVLFMNGIGVRSYWQFSTRRHWLNTT